MTDAMDDIASWEEPSTDWTAGVPARVVDVLTYAYGERDEIRRVASHVGIEWAHAPAAVSIRELWQWALRRAADTRSVMDLIAVVLHDDASLQFRAPLSQLLGDRLGEVNARIVGRHGLPPAPADGRDTVLDSIKEVDPARIDANRGGLQAITAVGGGFAEPRTKLNATQDLMQRTAMIRVAGQPAGTGFLVGERLLITAAHVLDRHSWPPRRQPGDVEAVFDFMYTTGRSYAETGTAVCVAAFVTGSLPTEDEAADRVGADWDAPADRLDFALLELAAPVPDPSPDVGIGAGPRGHYELHRQNYDYDANRKYMIMESALGDFLRVTDLDVSPTVSAGRTRMRYHGITMPGASGSAIVDVRGRLVGLHHYGGTARNQGVPISLVAQTLLTGVHAERFRGGPVAAAPPVDPFRTSAVQGRRPFVNRVDLREAIRDMAQPDGVRVLAINGQSGAGVSYSYLLASHVASRAALCRELRAAAPGGLRALRFDLRKYYTNCEIAVVRQTIALKLMADLGMIQNDTDPLAQKAHDTFAVLREIGGRLGHSDKMWLVFFDSIDDLTIVEQGEVDELIHGLMDLADEVPLRIVLAGRAAEGFANEHASSAALDYAEGLNRGHVEEWLRGRAAEEGHLIDEVRLAGKLTELFPPDRGLPEPRKLAATLPKALFEVLAP